MYAEHVLGNVPGSDWEGYIFRGCTRLSSFCPTHLADFDLLVKSHCKGGTAKNAILWTCKLTPHALHVRTGPNKQGFLL